MIWRLLPRKYVMYLASKGFYRYRGLSFMAPRSMPRGIVIYPDGKRSSPMALGCAFDYKKIFGGTVEFYGGCKNDRK
jgi:hypothetical protein